MFFSIKEKSFDDSSQRFGCFRDTRQSLYSPHTRLILPFLRQTINSLNFMLDMFISCEVFVTKSLQMKREKQWHAFTSLLGWRRRMHFMGMRPLGITKVLKTVVGKIMNKFSFLLIFRVLKFWTSIFNLCSFNFLL